MSRPLVLFIVVCSALFGAACSQIPSNIVPTTGNSANDNAAVQRFIPNIPNYTAVQAQSVQATLSSVSGGASLLSGNPALTAAIAQIDGMVTCYRNVGAADARVYYRVDVSRLAAGQIPSVGVLAVINQDRLVNNFLACALGAQPVGPQAAGDVPICSNAGSLEVEGETISYLYAGTDEQICALMAMPFRNIQ